MTQPPPYGPPGHYGPPPQPPKRNTGLVVGIVAAVVLVVGGVLVTGFVAPGFFLSEEQAPPPGPQPGPDGGELAQAKEVAQNAMTAINTRDEELARSISCSPEDAGDADNLPPDARAELAGEPQLVDPAKARVPVRFTADGKSEQEELELELRDGRWCVGS